jgi:hypothetical protein
MTHPLNSTAHIRNLLIALGLSAVMLGLGMAFVETVTSATTLRRLLLPLVRLIAFIALGLAAGQCIEAMGWTAMLGRLGAPLFRFARMGTHCSAAFSAAFLSGTTANAMLYDFWKDHSIDRRQLILTNLANQLPAFLLHLPTTFFIVLPLTGWAGAIYFTITFTAALVRLILVLIWGRWGPGAPPMTAAPPAGTPTAKKTSALAAIRRKLPRRLTTIATYVLPVYVAVFLLNQAGLFEWTRQWMARWVTTRLVPVEALSLVVLSFAAEFTSGFAAAGALLHEGVVTTQQAVLALLAGNIVAFPVRALRHQLPRLMGIFAPALGLQILVIGQSFRVASLLVIGMLYAVLF